MTIGPAPYRYNFSVDNNEVDANDTLKILGVTLDRKLSFVAHVPEQVKKGVCQSLCVTEDSQVYSLRRNVPPL